MVTHVTRKIVSKRRVLDMHVCIVSLCVQICSTTSCVRAMYQYKGIFTNGQCKYYKNTLYILHFHITIVFPTIASIQIIHACWMYHKICTRFRSDRTNHHTGACLSRFKLVDLREWSLWSLATSEVRRQADWVKQQMMFFFHLNLRFEVGWNKWWNFWISWCLRTTLKHILLFQPKRISPLDPVA